MRYATTIVDDAVETGVMMYQVLPTPPWITQLFLWHQQHRHHHRRHPTAMFLSPSLSYLSMAERLSCRRWGTCWPHCRSSMQGVLLSVLICWQKIGRVMFCSRDQWLDLSKQVIIRFVATEMFSGLIKSSNRYSLMKMYVSQVLRHASGIKDYLVCSFQTSHTKQNDQNW